jgi:hypothetical protein
MTCGCLAERNDSETLLQVEDLQVAEPRNLNTFSDTSLQHTPAYKGQNCLLVRVKCRVHSHRRRQALLRNACPPHCAIAVQEPQSHCV